MEAKRLHELMLEQYPYISYDVDVADEYLKFGAPDTDDEDIIAWCFADYIISIGEFEVEE